MGVCSGRLKKGGLGLGAGGVLGAGQVKKGVFTAAHTYTEHICEYPPPPPPTPEVTLHADRDLGPCDSTTCKTSAARTASLHNGVTVTPPSPKQNLIYAYGVARRKSELKSGGALLGLGPSPRPSLGQGGGRDVAPRVRSLNLPVNMWFIQALWFNYDRINHIRMCVSRSIYN